MAAFIKSLSRLLGGGKPAPAIRLAAFGKHPGWNDHMEDIGLDTDALVNAKRLLYGQGINQNIDSGAWDKLEPVLDPSSAGADDSLESSGSASVAAAAVPSAAAEKLDLFRHDFLWHVPPLLLAGRLWSSVDGKGRDKYPMVLCGELTDLPPSFAAQVVLPQLAKIHERCASATTANTIQQILSDESEALRSRIGESFVPKPLTAREIIAVAGHRDMAGNHEGFHRIVYQFALGMSAFRVPPVKNAPPRRTEQVRLPVCGMSPQNALHFWLRFALTFLDASTPILLFAPDQGKLAPWVDLIAGEPTPSNLFCIKAGTKSLPLTSDIPYTLDGSFTKAIESHLLPYATASEDIPLPEWPI